MSDIDVTYCAFARLNDVCASPINTQECKCSKIPVQNCYYKQLQQLKQENEELKNKLKIQKSKQIVVECGKRSFKNILHKYTLYQQCLDEIEEYLNQYVMLGKLNIKYLLQLIKQAKEVKGNANI